jgi:threonine dehydratase
MPSSAASDAPLRFPDIGDIRAAAQRLKGRAATTPLLESSLLNARLGGRLFVKPECLQRTGSFKFRGAYNAIAQLDETQRRGGVVAFSSGNHAQGVASAARLLGLPATIVMPADAPAIKIANTRAYGAEVVLYDRHSESRETIAAAIAATRGASLIPPYDDARVIAGQGTIGLEIVEQARALGLALDTAVVPAGGGGLIAGCALALAAESPTTRVYSAEPAEFDDLRRSLAEGRRVANAAGARSICDALQAPMPGELTFAINRERLAGAVAVSDAEICDAMRVGFADYKLVIEPGGAAALAAVLSGKVVIKDRIVAVVVSGGNVDRDAFVQALQAR